MYPHRLMRICGICHLNLHDHRWRWLWGVQSTMVITKHKSIKLHWKWKLKLVFSQQYQTDLCQWLLFNVAISMLDKINSINSSPPATYMNAALGCVSGCGLQWVNRRDPCRNNVSPFVNAATSTVYSTSDCMHKRVNIKRCIFTTKVWSLWITLCDIRSTKKIFKNRQAEHKLLLTSSQSTTILTKPTLSNFWAVQLCLLVRSIQLHFA